MVPPFSRVFFSLAVLAGIQLVVGVEPGLDRTGVEAVFVGNDDSVHFLFGEHRINIDALRAFPLAEGSSMQVFEVAIPKELDTRSLHRVMLERAKTMGLSLTMQHRDIFEAIHRVEIV